MDTATDHSRGGSRSDQAPDAEGCSGCICYLSPEHQLPHTQKLRLAYVGGLSAAAQDTLTNLYAQTSKNVSTTLSPIFLPTPTPC